MLGQPEKEKGFSDFSLLKTLFSALLFKATFRHSYVVFTDLSNCLLTHSLVLTFCFYIASLFLCSIIVELFSIFAPNPALIRNVFTDLAKLLFFRMTFPSMRVAVVFIHEIIRSL